MTDGTTSARRAEDQVQDTNDAAPAFATTYDVGLGTQSAMLYQSEIDLDVDRNEEWGFLSSFGDATDETWAIGAEFRDFLEKRIE